MTTQTTKHALSLYDLGDEVLALDDLAAMDDGEWTPELAQLADEVLEKLVTKADSFGGYVRDLELRESLLDAEVQRLTVRKKAIANRVAWMKRYGCLVLQRMGRPRVEGTLFTLALQNNPPKVEVSVLPDALPAEYVRIVPEVHEIDKVALAKALKAGVEVPGAVLVTSQSLRIR